MSVFDDLATKFKGLNTDLSERLKFDPPEADLPFTDYVKKARPQQAGVTSNALPPALTGAAPSPPPPPPAASPTPQPFGAKVAPYTPKVDEAKKKAQAWVSDYMKSKGFSPDDVAQSLAGGNSQRGIGPWESYGQQASKEGWTPEKGAAEAEKQARIFSTPGIQEKVPVVNKALQTAARKVGQGVGGVAALKGVPYAPRVGEVVGEVGAGMFEPRTADELANEPAWAQMLNAAPMGIGEQALVDDAIRAIFQPRLTATALAQGPRAYARTALETTGPAIGFPKQELRTAATTGYPGLGKSIEDAAKLAARESVVGLDDLASVQRALAEAEQRASETWEAFTKVQTSLESNPARNYTSLIPKTKLAGGELRYITPAQFKALFGAEPRESVVRVYKSGTKTTKAVPWEYALDQLTIRLGYDKLAEGGRLHADELLRNDIMRAAKDKQVYRTAQVEMLYANEEWKVVDALHKKLLASQPSAPAPTIGYGQAGMGIGEKPAQGGLFENLPGQAQAQPLANKETLLAKQARKAEVARGQLEMPPAPSVAPAAKPPTEAAKPFPPYTDNYTKQLSEYTDTLYREMNMTELHGLNPATTGYFRGAELYFANTPDLALGQGKNKGVLVEFASNNIPGQLNKKPTWEMLYQQNKAEFVSRHFEEGTLKRNIRSITIQKGTQATPTDKAVVKRWLSTWDATPNPDGSVTYRPKTTVSPTEAAPPVTSAMPPPAPPKAGLTPEQAAERAAAPWRKGPVPQGPPQPRPAPDVTVPPVEAPKASAAQGQAAEPPGAPPKPPTVAPPALMPEPQSIRGAVDEVLKALKEGKKLQPLTRAMQHEERVRRVKSAMTVLQNQGLSADEAFKQAKMAYAGKMERPGLTPPNIAPETQNLLRETIRSTPAIPETYTYTRTTADDALMKVFRGELPTKGEIELLGELFGPAFEQSLRDMLPTKDKIVEAALDLLNLPRTVKASFDLSAPLRQGMWLFPRHVQRALPDMVAMLRAFGSEKFARNLDNLYRGNLELGIAPDPSWVKSQEHGLYYAPLQRGAGTLTKREEAFMSRLAEKIPGVRMSERAYVTYLNKFRQDVWKYYSDQLAKAGAEGWEYDELAKFLNYATGRGDLKMFAQAAPQLSAIFFSPRMQAATIEMPLMMANKSKAVRRIATENIAATLGTGVSLLGLAALAGASVELDPRSSDFAKIRVGDTRIDVWAGKQQYNVLLARLISGRGKSSVTGNLYEIGGNSFAGDKLSLVGQFTRGKLAPGPALATDVFVGQDFLGRPMEWNRAGGIARSTLVPMSVDTMVEAAQQDGTLGALFATPGVLGVGVSSYGSKVADMNERWRKDLQEYRDLPSNANEAKAKGTLTRDKYRERHPDIEAKLFLLGEVESLQSIGARVQALKFMKELGVGMADVRGLQPKPYESTDRAALRRWFETQLGVQPTSSPSRVAPNREPVPAGAPSRTYIPLPPGYKE